jgi:hypothetical protein
VRVVVPFVPGSLRAETVAACEAQTSALELIDVSAEATSYWALVADLWGAQEPFVLIEHDIVISPGTLAAFERCPHPWCSAASDHFGGHDGWWDAMLHCNRFKAEAMRGHPDLFASMPPWCRHWLSLDAKSLPRLQRRIGPPHCHAELVNQHLRGDRETGGYPWPSEVDRWAEPLFAYSAWLAQFAPDEDELPALAAETGAARGARRDDLEFLECRLHAAAAARALRATTRVPATATEDERRAILTTRLAALRAERDKTVALLHGRLPQLAA